MSNEIIKPPDNTLAPTVKYTGKITFNHGMIVNIYIVYELTKNNAVSSNPKIKNCLFGAIKLVKATKIDEYKYTGYVIGFDGKGNFSHPSGFGRNVAFIGADMNSPVDVNNRKTNLLIIGEGIIQIDNTTLAAEKMYCVNFTENNKKFCLSLHYNGANSYLFVNVQKLLNLRQRILRLQQIQYF